MRIVLVAAFLAASCTSIHHHHHYHLHSKGAAEALLNHKEVERKKAQEEKAKEAPSRDQDRFRPWLERNRE